MHRHFLWQIIKYCLCALLLSSGVSYGAVAQVPAPARPDAETRRVMRASVVAPSPTTADLETFFDGLMPYLLRREDIVGGVILIVKDGRILFAKGYGYSDLGTRKAISPSQTLFRPGSISKLFTWTAVMQLAEQGKLDLDADINTYLDFKIPPKFGKPVTLRNLLTHTSGFEEVNKSLFLESMKDLYPLDAYLKARQPVRIFAPGNVIAYSNYGSALAGYIVQRTSKLPFDRYVENHILKPLGMMRSTMAQPVPAALRPFVARGYNTASEGKSQPFEVIEAAPAGSMSTTATDMARFMIANLSGGAFEGGRILKPETLAQMHRVQHRPGPGINGVGLGFFEGRHGDHHLVGHGGDMPYFHSDMQLVPDLDLGIFMSFNSTGRDDAVDIVRPTILKAFLDKYYPGRRANMPDIATARQDAARVAGWYESSRRNESALRFIATMMQAQVVALPDGKIETPSFPDLAGRPKSWQEVGPMTYQEVGGSERLSFAIGQDGAISHFAIDSIPVFNYQRVGFFDRNDVVLPALLGSVVILIATLIIWIAGGILRRRYGRLLELTRRERRLRLGSRLAAAISLMTAIGWPLLMASLLGQPLRFLAGRGDPWMYLLHGLGVLAILGAFVVVVHMAKTWTAPRSIAVKLGETLLACASLTIAALILAFGLANFNLNY